MAVEKTSGSGSLAEVVARILDKDVVVDAWVRVSPVGKRQDSSPDLDDLAVVVRDHT